MAEPLIYIADDEINICNIIRSFLVKEGYAVETFGDGPSLLAAFAARPADMVLLDIMLPGMDGYSLCAAIRQKSPVPIIFVSAKDTEPDKIAGLTLGGDDYLTKPFSPMELVARVKSIFRRIALDREQPGASLDLGGLTINPDTKSASLAGRNLGLTGMEFALLHYLAVNRHRAVSRAELLRKVWGFEREVETRATDDTIKRIRKKLADAGAAVKIETVWGYGFQIREKD